MIFTFTFLIITFCQYANSFINLSILSTNFNKVYPVNELDISKYMGIWYAVLVSPIVYTFQGYGKCMRAEYQIMSENNISVINTQESIKGKYEQIRGYAFYKNVSEPGKLSVSLDGIPFIAPYWVIALGEIKDDQYQYSIVSVPSATSLWVLTRNVLEYYRKYNNEVISFLDKYEFKYDWVDQLSCDYLHPTLDKI